MDKIREPQKKLNCDETHPRSTNEVNREQKMGAKRIYKKEVSIRVKGTGKGEMLRSTTHVNPTLGCKGDGVGPAAGNL